MWILSPPTPNALPCFSHGSFSRLRLPPTNRHLRLLSNCSSRSSLLKTSATLDEKDADSSTQPSPLQQGQSNREVEKSAEVLKNAAKTRKVPANDVISALSVIEKAKLDPSEFLPTLGRFRITRENLDAYIYSRGRFSWKNRILAFIFEHIRIKVGPLKPLEVSLGQTEDREPSTKDPFFIWFYVYEEIAVARGRSGGTAFWC